MTCNLCNGTYVDQGNSGSLMFKQPCPNCGPMPEEMRAKKKAEFRERLQEAKRQFGLAEKDVS